jgi:hypothetical protein
MPATQEQSGRRNGFDRTHFHEILQRFNSETAEEVDSAVCDALRVCDRLRMSFCDAVLHTYGSDERLAELEAQLTVALEECARKEKQRSYMEAQVHRAWRKFAELSAENARFRLGVQYCEGCERSRRVLAGAAGLLMGAASLRLFLPHGLTRWSVTVIAILAFSPLTLTYCRWRWLLFSRKVKWNSKNDNEIVRWWKGLP